jgi:hypothetical protein
MGHRVAHTTEAIDVFWRTDVQHRTKNFPHDIQGREHRHSDSFICPPVTRQYFDETGFTNKHQKPVNVMAELVYRYCPRGGVVIDVTCGSGTTAKVAHRGEKLRSCMYYLCDREAVQVHLAEYRYDDEATSSFSDEFTSLSLPPLAYRLEKRYVASLDRRSTSDEVSYCFPLNWSHCDSLAATHTQRTPLTLADCSVDCLLRLSALP